MITLTFALPAESSGLLRRLTEKRVLWQNGVKVIAGRLDGREIEIVHTGVGRIAGDCLQRYLSARSPALLISSGFAGATHPGLEVGDLVLARNFSDARLLAGARALLAGENVQVARLFTAPAMVDSPGEREEIWRRHEAEVIDMETEAMAQLCAHHPLPMLSLRVLSDTPRDPFPLPSRVLFDVQRQRTPAGRLFLYLLVHPAAVPRLLRFSRQISRARQRLTDALVALLHGELSA